MRVVLYVCTNAWHASDGVCVRTCKHMTASVLREDREAPSRIHMHRRDVLGHIPQCECVENVLPDSSRVREKKRMLLGFSFLFFFFNILGSIPRFLGLRKAREP